MVIFFQELVMLLFLWLLKLIDSIMEIFNAISGIATVTYQGKQVNILDVFIGDSTIGTVFWCVFIIAIGLTCIFAIVGLVKNIIANNRQVSSIMGKFFLSILGTMAMVAVVFLGILISNSLLKLTSEVFQLSGTTKLSSTLFNACTGNWLSGHSVKEFNTDLSVGKILGTYNATLGIWPTSWKSNGMVKPDTFMYLPAMIASIGLLIAFIKACINLVKRLYEIVFMYLVMPISMSTLPLDDGARFKNWREQFVTKIILAYGAVFSVNIFILLLPIITQMKLSGVSSFTNSVFMIFMLIGGSMVIPAGQQLFAKLFGTPEDMETGNRFMRSGLIAARMSGAAVLGITKGVVRGGAKIGKKVTGHGRGGGHGGGSGSGSTGGEERFSEERGNSSNDGAGTDGTGDGSGGSGGTDAGGSGGGGSAGGGA